MHTARPSCCSLIHVAVVDISALSHCSFASHTSPQGWGLWNKPPASQGLTSSLTRRTSEILYQSLGKRPGRRKSQPFRCQVWRVVGGAGCAGSARASVPRIPLCSQAVGQQLLQSTPSPRAQSQFCCHRPLCAGHNLNHFGCMSLPLPIGRAPLHTHTQPSLR